MEVICGLWITGHCLKKSISRLSLDEDWKTRLIPADIAFRTRCLDKVSFAYNANIEFGGPAREMWSRIRRPIVIDSRTGRPCFSEKRRRLFRCRLSCSDTENAAIVI